MSILQELKKLANANPTAFALLGPLNERSQFHRRVVRKTDDLVIEGFPRSANTFTTEAFRISYPDLKIGNHFHSPMQIALAHRYGIPALVVIRSPREAVRSFYVYHQGELSPGAALDRYIGFHEKIVPYSGSFVVLDFREAISDVNTGVDRLNGKFGMGLAPMPAGEDFTGQVQASIEAKRQSRIRSRSDEMGSLARQTTPSEFKARAAAEAAEKLAAPEFRARFETAEELYQRFYAMAR